MQIDLLLKDLQEPDQREKILDLKVILFHRKGPKIHLSLLFQQLMITKNVNLLNKEPQEDLGVIIQPKILKVKLDRKKEN